MLGTLPARLHYILASPRKRGGGTAVEVFRLAVQYSDSPAFTILKLFRAVTVGIVNALEALRNPISMFEPIYSDGGDTIFLYDQIEDKKQKGSEMENRLATSDAITMLPDRCQHILEERFIIGKTQMEVAEELAISQAQVSRLEKTAVKQLKKILK